MIWSNDNQLGASGGLITLDNGDLKADGGDYTIAAARTIAVTANGGFFQQGSNSGGTTVASKITGRGVRGDQL